MENSYSQFKMIFFDVLKCDSTYNWEKKVANYSECPQISPYGHVASTVSTPSAASFSGYSHPDFSPGCPTVL